MIMFIPINEQAKRQGHALLTLETFLNGKPEGILNGKQEGINVSSTLQFRHKNSQEFSLQLASNLKNQSS